MAAPRTQLAIGVFGVISFAVAILNGALPHASAAETIVGRWMETSQPGSRCIGVASINIRPMSLGVGEDFGCDFKDVSRSGDVVTWHGICTAFGENEVGRKETVVASLKSNTLTVSVKGWLQQTYRRCHEPT